MKNCRRSRVDIITPILHYSHTPFSHYLMSRLAEIIAHKRQEIAPWLNHTEDWDAPPRAHLHFRNFPFALQTPPFGFIPQVKPPSPPPAIIPAYLDPLPAAPPPFSARP